MADTHTAIARLSTMLLDDNTGATAADRSSRKKNEPNSGIARRSINGLKQLFRLHETVQSARSNSSHPPSTNPGPDRASIARTALPTSSDVSPNSRPPSHRQSPAEVGASNRKHRISRVFSSVVSRFKRDSGVALSDAGDTIQDDTEFESQCLDNNEVYDEDAYSDDGQPGEHEHDRRNFLAIRAIPRKTIEDFVLSLIYPDDELDVRTCRVIHRKEGSFHHAVFLAIEIGGKVEQEYVLKIPAHGTSQHWRHSDGFMLENEARLVQHIRHHTKCPVPEVVAYHEQLNNSIGAPFILMKKIKGIPAIDMWLGHPYKSISDAELHVHADDPSPELEQKRITFLRSLAQAMSELAPLKFNEIGIPVFYDPKNEQPDYIGSAWRWHSKSDMQALTPIGPFETSKEFFTAALNEAWNPDRDYSAENKTRDVALLRGVRKILDIVIDSAPFTPTFTFHSEDGEIQTPKQESFVLRHDDLDLQNILVSSSGHVTGIIDWDSCTSVPACIGYTSLPTFLRRDFLPEYSMARAPHMTWAFEHYREVYAEAMEEYVGEEAKYTGKSAVLQMVLAALEKDVDGRDVVEMLMKEIPEFRRVHVQDFWARVGFGWPDAEIKLGEKIRDLLVPECKWF